MRKSNQEITDIQILEAILTSATICRIAMIDEGKPYLLPFNYGYRDNTIFIHCATSGRKTEILKKNPAVCFEVEDTTSIVRDENPCKWTTVYRSVVGSGVVEIINDVGLKKQGLNVIMRHHGADGPFKFEDREVGNMLILKLSISEMTGKQSGNWERIMKSNSVGMETDRLIMEETSEQDLEDIHNLHSIPEVDEFNTLGIPRTIQDTINLTQPLFESKKEIPRSRYEWKILTKESKEFIGLAGMTLSNDKYRLGEIYYKFNPAHWNKGYATEVAKELIRTGFEHFGLHKVEAGVAKGNVRSVRVLEKCGMTMEGTRRKILPIRGDWVDNYHFAIVESDTRNG